MEELDRLIVTRSGFHEAVFLAFEKIASEGCREFFICDDDFEDWPLGDPALIESLAAWARQGRRLHVVARSFDGFVRRHPRWVTWRRLWSHVVQCRSVEEIETGACPCLLVAPGLIALRLSDRVHHRGRFMTQAADVQCAREQFDAVSQHSIDAFPRVRWASREYPSPRYNRRLVHEMLELSWSLSVGALRRWQVYSACSIGGCPQLPVIGRPFD